ncbi:hypothetical protein P8T58_00680 [Haemophilus influenzae]|nr:hypothetical protein P8T58_00680 [Haemophilus influenzae]WFL73142.1 hypothetical protein P8T60_00685 [Haemophilus influenzae]WFL75074.1 hypothetical protein P8T59_00685 [Haemophilus influenzae]
MKKLFALTLCAMAVVGCNDKSTESSQSNQPKQTEVSAVNTEQKTSEIKAVIPEKYIDVPFSKTEKGRVIYKNPLDAFENGSDYNSEDKTLVINAKSPLKVTLKEDTAAELSVDDVKQLLEHRFILAVYQFFTYTNENEIEITLEPVKEGNKPYGKGYKAIKGKITREQALKTLQTFSGMKDFDDYVSFDKDSEWVILGFTPSKKAQKFTSSDYQSQILNSLLTGKIDTPYEIVKLPIDVDFTNIQVKLKKAFDLSLFQNDSRTLTNGDKEYSTVISDFVKVYAIEKDKNHLVQVAVQFAFVNNADIVMQSTGAIAAAMLATPDPNKSFKIMTSMMEAASKKIKKSKNKDKAEEVRLVDGLTLKLTVHPNLGGIAFLTIEKLEKRPVKFE